MKPRIAVMMLGAMFCVAVASFAGAESPARSTILREQTSRSTDIIENQVREAIRPAKRPTEPARDKGMAGSDRDYPPSTYQPRPGAGQY